MAYALALVLQLSATTPREVTETWSLTAAAQASGRPPECAARQGTANKWDAARDPAVERYCDLLARGFAELGFAPENARERADLADRLSPGHAAPSVLRGRAYAIAKDYGHALSELVKARSLDPRSLDDPASLRDFARVLAATGRSAEALRAYRALAMRVVLLPSTEERARVLLEAAELSSSLGPSGLDDAIAFLTEAKEVAGRDLGFRVTAELSLLLDRKGKRREAASMALTLLPRFRKEPAALAGETEATDHGAAIAFLWEAVDPARARKAWEDYLRGAADNNPWIEHAEAHIETLKGKGRSR